MMSLDLTNLRATPVSKRSASERSGGSSGKKAPLTSRRSGAMSTPALVAMGVQLAPTHECQECGPIDFTMNANGRITCGDCGSDVVAIKRAGYRSTGKTHTSAAAGHVSDENAQMEGNSDMTPSGKQVSLGKSSTSRRRRKLFQNVDSPRIVELKNSPMRSTVTPQNTPSEKHASSSRLSTPAAQISSTAAPSTPDIVAKFEAGPAVSTSKGSPMSVRCGLKLEGRFLLCRASRPPMTSGFYKITVIDIATGVETEFISCESEKFAFETWPHVDFTALLTTHYDSSPRRAPFVWRTSISSCESKKRFGTPGSQVPSESLTPSSFHSFSRTPSGKGLSVQMENEAVSASKTIEAKDEHVTNSNYFTATTPSTVFNTSLADPALVKTVEHVAVRAASLPSTNSNVEMQSLRNNEEYGFHIQELERKLQKEIETREECEIRLQILSESGEERLAQLLEATSRHDSEMSTCEETIKALEQELKGSNMSHIEEIQIMQAKLSKTKMLQQLLQLQNSALNNELQDAKSIMKVFDEEDARKQESIDMIVEKAVKEAVQKAKQDAEKSADEEWNKWAAETTSLVAETKRQAEKRIEDAVSAALSEATAAHLEQQVQEREAMEKREAATEARIQANAEESIRLTIAESEQRISKLSEAQEVQKAHYENKLSELEAKLKSVQSELNVNRHELSSTKEENRNLQLKLEKVDEAAGSLISEERAKEIAEAARLNIEESVRSSVTASVTEQVTKDVTEQVTKDVTTRVEADMQAKMEESLRIQKSNALREMTQAAAQHAEIVANLREALDAAKNESDRAKSEAYAEVMAAKSEAASASASLVALNASRDNMHEEQIAVQRALEARLAAQEASHAGKIEGLNIEMAALNYKMAQEIEERESIKIELSKMLESANAKCKDAEAKFTTQEEECTALKSKIEELNRIVADAAANEVARQNDPSRPLYSQAEFDAHGQKMFNNGAASEANKDAIDKEAVAAAEKAVEDIKTEFEAKIKKQEERMTKEMRVLLLANEALKAEKAKFEELKNQEVQECVDIIEQIESEKSIIEKRQAAFDEKYNLSQSLLAKRNDQLKDVEAALQAAQAQKEALQKQSESKSIEISEAKQRVTLVQKEIAEKEKECAANILEMEAAKKESLAFRKKLKRADKEALELRAHFEKEFEKCKKLLSENSAEANKMKSEKRKLMEQLSKLRLKRKEEIAEKDKSVNTNKLHVQKLNAEIGNLRKDLESHKNYSESLKEKFEKREEQLLELTSENADMKSKLEKATSEVKNLNEEKNFLLNATEKLVRELEEERSKDLTKTEKQPNQEEEFETF